MLISRIVNAQVIKSDEDVYNEYITSLFVLFYIINRNPILTEVGPFCISHDLAILPCNEIILRCEGGVLLLSTF